eukprot:Platyproteum_vivax@DN3002_c0_g1_i1.p1
MDEALKGNNVSPVGLAYCEARQAIGYGTDLKHLGVAETGRDEGNWTDGQDNFRLDNGYKQVLDWYLEQLQEMNVLMLLKTEVDIIIDERSEDKSDENNELSTAKFLKVACGRELGPREHLNCMVVHTKQDQCYYGKAVVVTVPLPILQNEDITFEPPLSEEKMAALRSVKMGHGMKIIVALDTQLWPTTTDVIYCPCNYYPQMWIHHKITKLTDGTNRSCYLATGLLTGSEGIKAEGLADSVLYDRFCEQLDDLYLATVTKNSLLGSATRKSTIQYKVFHWGLEKHFQGAYTYPTPHSSLQSKTLIAEKHGGVHFGGEHASTRTGGTVQASMESAERIVKELKEVLTSK